jgi:hypothetical protein
MKHTDTSQRTSASPEFKVPVNLSRETIEHFGVTWRAWMGRAPEQNTELVTRLLQLLEADLASLALR